MTKEKFYTIALHFGGWVIFFSLPFIFVISQSAGSNRLFSGNLFNVSSFLIYILIFYLHTYFLFPKLFFGKKWLLYFFSMALLLGVVYVVRPFDRLTNRNQVGRNEIVARQNFPPGNGYFPSRQMPADRPPPPPQQMPPASGRRPLGHQGKLIGAHPILILLVLNYLL